MYRRNRHQGGALLIAVFVIVVMAALTAAITKNISASTDQTVYEVLGTRALLAAEMGNEKKLADLFSYNGNTANCSVGEEVRIFNVIDAGATYVPGLEHCAYIIDCSTNSTGGVNYYSISTTGLCKADLDGTSDDFFCAADEFCVSRTVEVEAKL